jgi:hypothetical protein
MERLTKKFGTTADFFKNLFRSDPTLHLDLAWIDDAAKDPGIFYVEERRNFSSSFPNAPLRRALDAFTLHSRPGASKVIYLDFDGHVITGTAWNDASRPSITAPPADWDGSPSTFSATEHSYIQEIWARVAEDYAPFDIDVTTEYIGGNENFLTRSSLSDQQYGIRVLISPGIASIWCSCGGIAYVGIYGNVNNGYYQPALVFPDLLGNSPKNIAEAASHEAGHNFGLNHDGTATAGYYTGQGTGETGWAPIMGVGYSKNLVQWSRGEYSGANNLEDDLAIIARLAPYTPDDRPATLSAAASAPLPPGPALAAAGVIEKTGDVDVFAFAAGAGALSVTASPALASGNLDLRLELLNGAGAVLATANPVDRLAATVAATLPAAGTYYLRVTGVGAGSATSTGYSNYGSVGRYTLAGTFPAGGTVVPPRDSTTPPPPPAGGVPTTAPAPPPSTKAKGGGGGGGGGRPRDQVAGLEASYTPAPGSGGNGPSVVVAAAGGVGGGVALLASLGFAWWRLRRGAAEAGGKAAASGEGDGAGLQWAEGVLVLVAGSRGGGAARRGTSGEAAAEGVSVV